MRNNKIFTQIISLLIAGGLIFSSSILWAEDYPSTYLDPGYRDYLLMEV